MAGQKGVITVYVTLIFLLVVSLIFTVAESARVQSARMMLEVALDCAMESVAAGYQKELYEEYQLFFVDGSQGTGVLNMEKIAGGVREQIDYVFQPDRETGLRHTDFYKMGVADMTVDKLALATDDNGKVFRNEVVESMKASLGITAVEALASQYEWAMDYVDESETYAKTESETKETLNQLQEEKKQVDLEKVEDAQLAQSQRNPTEEVEEIRSAGILGLVYPDSKSLSSNCVDAQSLPSQRKLFEGTGPENYEEHAIFRVLFQQYLSKQFACAVTDEEATPGSLQYELEYLLIGEEHDVDNLKGVVNRLLLLREGVNFAYLMTDQTKVMQAYEAAVLLVGYTGMVPLVEATKYAILLSWAFGESIVDLKILLSGEKVVVVKDAATWKTSLENIGQVASMDVKSLSDDGGIRYKDYLALLMLASNQDELAMRALDLVELDIRQRTGNMHFRIDCCVAMAEVTVCTEAQVLFPAMPLLNGRIHSDRYTFKATRSMDYKR